MVKMNSQQQETPLSTALSHTHRDARLHRSQYKCRVCAAAPSPRLPRATLAAPFAPFSSATAYLDTASSCRKKNRGRSKERAAESTPSAREGDRRPSEARKRCSMPGRTQFGHLPCKWARTDSGNHRPPTTCQPAHNSVLRGRRPVLAIDRDTARTSVLRAVHAETAAVST